MKPTYIIFDAIGISDQHKSNYGILRSLSAWQHSYPARFKFNDLDDVVFCATHTGLEESRIKTYLVNKIDEADNVLILASEKLNKNSSILNWQVEQAIHRKLPIIVCYVGMEKMDAAAIDAHAAWLPVKLLKAQKEGIKIAHIPYTMDKIERACKNFSEENGLYAWNGKTIY